MNFAFGQEFPSAIVHLASHQFEPAPRDAVGLAVARGDRLFALQFLEQQRVDDGHAPALAIVEFEASDTALCVLQRLDKPALSEGVQHPLFVSGNVQFV